MLIKVVRNGILMINFLFCTVLPPGTLKVDKTHNFYDFLMSVASMAHMVVCSATIDLLNVRSRVLESSISCLV